MGALESFFGVGNKEKSEGAKSELYGESLIISLWNSHKIVRVWWEEWVGTLSWFEDSLMKFSQKAKTLVNFLKIFSNKHKLLFFGLP